MHESVPVSAADVMHAAALIAAATVVAREPLPVVSEKEVDQATRADQIVALAREIVDRWGKNS